MHIYMHKDMHTYHTSSGPCALFLFPAPHKTPSRLFKRLRHTQGYDTDTHGGTCIGSRSFVLGSRSCVRAGRNEDSDDYTGLAIYLYVYVHWCVPLPAFAHIYIYVYLYMYIYICIYSALPAPVNRFCVSLYCCCVPLLRALSCFLLSF